MTITTIATKSGGHLVKEKRTTRIKFISFYHNGARKAVHAKKDGTFRLPVSSVRSGTVRTEYKSLTAKQVIEHEIIKGCDPVLTLTTGEKVRVYTSGDSSYLPALSDGIVLKHDEYHKMKKKLMKNQLKLKKDVLIPPYPRSDDDMEQMGFPWDWPDEDIF